MSLWKIAWRSIQQRALASGLTAFSIGLGVALVVAVLVIHGVIDQSFRRGSQGYDLIVGAKGDRLQLVLNTVFHLGQPTDNIPYSFYERLVQEEFSAAVETAIPVCTGHSYKGFQAIATVPGMFEELTYLDGRTYEFAEGRNFLAEEPFEAVIGARVAKETGLKVGDEFAPSGTAVAAEADSAHEDEPFTVVGILKHTSTPNDRALFMNIEGFYQCSAHAHGPSFARKFLTGSIDPETSNPATDDEDDAHDHDGEAAHDHEDDAHAHDDEAAHDHEDDAHDHDGEAAHDHEDDAHDHDGEAAHDHEDEAHDHDGEAAHDHEDDAHAHDGEAAHEHEDDAHDHEGHAHEHERQITAVLVCTDMNQPELAIELPDTINAGLEAQAVQPAQIIFQLFDGIVGNVQLLLLVLAVLVVVVAGIGILVSIYNSMTERRHEIAVMRALGAGRGTVMAIILTESILLSLGGGALGIVLGHGLIGALAPTIAEQTGVIVSAFQFQLVELILIPGLILLATLVGFLPALSAYRTDVAKALIAAP